MAPSRGDSLACARRIFAACNCPRTSLLAPRRSYSSLLMGRTAPWSLSLPSKRPVAYRRFSSFVEKLADPSNKLQSYISSSDDPYLNLSIEHVILQKSPADSTVLFLYVNRPCVVIGRNQNPWTEVNLGILNGTRQMQNPKGSEPPAMRPVDLVRRRSGGGTVFHDEGNLNWSITCPRNDFTRDKHAEMVVRALRKLGIQRARVNERHDIVLDQGHERRASDPHDTHRTLYTVDQGTLPRPLKVSGSAYKLTRQRALHHATTLLSSPNLHIIPQYLRSPAKKLIEAKGVESVSSPVANIGLDVKAFQKCLQAEFANMYANLGTPSIIETVHDEYLNIPEVRKGYEELRTDDWMWSQTPQFHLSLDPSVDIGVDMDVHHGIIKSVDFKGSLLSTEAQQDLRIMLLDQKLQDIHNWTRFLQTRLKKWDERSAAVARRLDELMPIPAPSMSMSD
ncbi:lipoate-protein ligase A [Cucurbitaria berberidis CBS 394.84]|uniref:Putative lipoate-protein ligase A n=1 Tax=Cucurbitaria berberidis CBS 394.84 TaxID=1168544 RepID=A0A9P4LCS8_9PLEO|nr:lipoate-protein ligase A [Cucurbitaria berberidis CBS 394.84]KAF1849682.1 lipoate-protein ligase A [Cucurbitaria berberidis CBS 394.84]